MSLEESMSVLSFRLKSGMDANFNRLNRLHELSQTLSSADESTRQLFKLMYNDLSEIKTEFNDLMQDIINALVKTSTRPEIDLQVFTKEFDNKYYAIKLAYSITFQDDKPSPDVSNIISQCSNESFRLNKINVPTFTGDLSKWSQFKELFYTLVHNNSKFADIQKHVYLRASLDGEPLNLIKSLEITSLTYNEALSILEKRYDNKRDLSAHHFSALMDVPNASSHNYLSVRALANTVREHITSLKALGHQVDAWSPLILFLMQRKLDRFLLQDWEKLLTTITDPSVTHFTDFLDEQARLLHSVGETLKDRKFNSHPKSRSLPTTKPTNSSMAFVTKTKEGANPKPVKAKTSLSCPLCNGNHYLRQCNIFLNTSLPQRLDLVNTRQLCLNCLNAHKLSDCKSSYTCFMCGLRHHTLLHNHELPDAGSNSPSSGTLTSTPSQQHLRSNPQSSTSSPPSFNAHITNSSQTPSATTLLSTVVGRIQDYKGDFHLVRILLDSASESSFITTNCVHLLKLPYHNGNVQIQGLSQQTIGTSNGNTCCIIKPVQGDQPVLKVSALVVDKIATTPSQYVYGSWPHLRGLSLADPQFGQPGPIDILLGSQFIPRILMNGRRLGPPNTPSALETIFGWTLMGRAETITSPERSLSCHTSSDFPLDDIVRRFWELEEFPVTKPTEPDHLVCEEIFKNTTFRLDSGRYVVRLPFKKSSTILSDTFSTAFQRFMSLERRLESNPNLRSAYHTVMQDYITQGHMKLQFSAIPLQIRPDSCFIPHHAVLRPGSDLTKLRVVYDASAVSPSGASLNKALYTGPKLQSDLRDVLLKFRMYPVVFMADIRQMYRQVCIHKDDQRYQQILWRFDKSKPLQVYQLQTVTFGVTAAPYLALRTIQQLVQDEGHQYPLAANTLLNSTYVDDVVGGGYSISEAQLLKTQLIELLKKGEFQLRKWVSSHPDLLVDLPKEYLLPKCVTFDENEEKPICKVLGLSWDSSNDLFFYVNSNHDTPSTKRGMLAAMSRIFDPCGWLSPLTMLIKQQIRALWINGTDWDEAPPPECLEIWSSIQRDLPSISSIKIPRHVDCTSGNDLQLHAFADASENGYAAAIYLRGIDCHQIPRVRLILAKSKVSPPTPMIIARLELCGALLATELAHHAKEVLKSISNISSVTIWSDSSVTLQWIKSLPYKREAFVANRVVKIHSMLPPSSFRYVPSAANPADCASRGLLPSQLTQFPEWFEGPRWLHDPTTTWSETFKSMRSPVLKKKSCNTTISLVGVTSVARFEQLSSLFERQFNSFSTLRRVTALCLRFCNNIDSTKPKLHGPLAVRELHAALGVWVRAIQECTFSDDIKRLQNGTPLKGHLRKLHPFLKDGILRVGGRIRLSEVPYGQKHPIILPKSHIFTTLVIQHFHEKYCHPGPNALLSLIRQQFWILDGRNIVRHTVLRCLKCFRAKPTRLQPLMGELPFARLQAVKAFVNVGIDYAGPIQVKQSNLRKSKITKGYVCTFVCFSTTAVHLELVSDLSTDAFLAALRRFIGRRGRISAIYSDCGTNFIGASRQLKSWFSTYYSDQRNECISKALSEHGITWHFNPPSAPHFGGLWEAAVKSMKTLLVRTIGDHLLSYEELTTLLVQIEASLNSRPLTPLSPDPSEISALTPAHFLFQEPPFSLYEPELPERPINLLKRWSLLQNLMQSFWKRWRSEYLHELQVRIKWSKKTSQLKLNDLVLIKDDNTPPLKWSLGRVIQIHPGADNIVRVATVKTPKGEYKRPVVKLCLLPFN